MWSLAGKLPGGAPGRLRHQAVYGKTFGIEIAFAQRACGVLERLG